MIISAFKVLAFKLTKSPVVAVILSVLPPPPPPVPPPDNANVPLADCTDILFALSDVLYVRFLAFVFLEYPF